MNRKTSTRIAALLIVMVALVGVSQSSAVGSGEVGTTGSELEPTASDVASQLGVPLHELELEQQLIDELGALNAKLGEVQGFLQLWISWEPFTVNASYTSELSEDDRSLLLAFSRQDLLRHHSADVDFVTLEALLLKVVAERDRLGIDADVSVDFLEERVEIGAQGNVGDTLVNATTEKYGSDTVADRLAVAEYSSSTFTTRGGGAFPRCSAAFIVTNSNNYGTRYGVLSAGHDGCNSNSTYTDRGKNYSTSVQYSAVANRRDVSIHQLTGGSAQNVFSVPFHPGARFVRATRSWAAMMVGESVCMNGQTSGWTCGTINSKNYGPSYVPGGNRFIETTNTCAYGDSGATWSSGSTAYGIESGFRDSNSRCLFGTIDYALSGTGWYVKTS